MSTSRNSAIALLGRQLPPSGTYNLTANLSSSWVSQTIFLEKARFYHVQGFYSASAGGTGSFRLQSSIIQNTIGGLSGTNSIVWSNVPNTSQTITIPAGTGSFDYEVSQISYPYARVVYDAKGDTVGPTGSVWLQASVKE